MKRNLPPLNALRAFDAAGRHESFSRAAQELSVSHSAICRHVRGLEDRLGVKLFQEESRGVALTRDGHAYLNRIGPALEAISDATEGVWGKPAGQVTVNSEPLFAQQVIAPHLGAFAQAHPDIELRLDMSNMLADVDRYEADFAVRFVRSGVPDRAADVMSMAALCVYAAPSTVADGLPSASQILSMPRMQDRWTDTWARWATAAGLAPPNDPHRGWRLRAPMALQAAAGGHGVFLGSSDCAHRMVEVGLLKRISDVTLQEGGFFLISPNTARRSKAERVVRDWLLDVTAGYRRPDFLEKDQPIG